MKRRLVFLLTALIVFFALRECSHYNFLLFHNIAEVFSIIIACGIFMVAWNCRRYLDNQYFLFIGIAYLFIGMLDLAHAFSYKGMNLLPGYGANTPTQLWIAARYLQSLTLLAAPLMLRRQIRPGFIILSFGGIVSLLFLSIFTWRIFPDCFIEGAGGLTPFKKISELIICLFLLTSGLVLVRMHRRFSPRVLAWIMASILLTIFSELFFTGYTDVYGFLNILGHYLKIVSFYCVYKAIIETGLTRPFEMLFRDLSLSKERYQSLFVHMTNGFAHHRIMTDEDGSPIDYRFLEVNKAFKALTGLDDVVGRQVTDVMPGIQEDPADWIGLYGKVAATGISTRFENYSEELKRWYSVCAYCPANGEFVTIFEDITDRKQTQQSLQDANKELERKVRERTTTLANLVNDLEEEIELRRQAESELKRLNQKLGVRANQLRKLAGELTMAEQRERRRLSRILHDGLQQDLAAAKLQLGAMGSRLYHGDFRETARDIEGMLGECIQISRSLSAELCPPMLYEKGLVAGLEWLVRWMREKYGFKVDLSTVIFAELPEDVKVLVFESVRELLFNAVKHSHACGAAVCLESINGAGLCITVSDDGAGFDVCRLEHGSDNLAGLGLFSIRERIGLIGGGFLIDSAPGKGSRFILKVPGGQIQSVSVPS
jgi:signal transduction histidine kinase